MNSQIIGLLAETSIHTGAGQSSGIVDLPVAREATTDYPVIPGSSLKGALRDYARQIKMDDTKLNRTFGKSDNAGVLLVSDARLLLLPVRSLQSAYKWVTCPHLLERFGRDCGRIGNSRSLSISSVAAGQYLGAGNGNLFLEERQFSCEGHLPTGLAESLCALLPDNLVHANTRKRLQERLVVLNDSDFVWFARYGLTVQARNVLDEEKKTSLNLWYEEAVPTDALFYAVLAERGDGAITPDLFKNLSYLQVGGNETVGMGWFAIKIPQTKGGPA